MFQGDFLGVKIKRARTYSIFSRYTCLAISMESSRQDLLNYTGERKSILKNNQKAY